MAANRRVEKDGYSAHIIPQGNGEVRIEIPVSAWTLVGEVLEEDADREADSMLTFVARHFGFAPRREIKRCRPRNLGAPTWFLREFKDL